MEIRFNTINEDVEMVLEEIDKHNRKFFVETAILHYINHLESNADTIDLFYSSRKKSEPKPKETKVKADKVKPKESKSEKMEKVEEKLKATDNSSLALGGW